jgi:hypothetical protein
MAAAARWLEWQGYGAAARTAAVALGAGATAATAGAFIHAAFTPGANHWLRMPELVTVQHASRKRRREITTMEPLAPITAVARWLIGLTGLLRPEPRPLEELHAPDDGYGRMTAFFNANALVRAPLAVLGLRLRVLRLRDEYCCLDPELAIEALTAWRSTLVEWDAELDFEFVGAYARSVRDALAGCQQLRILRCDGLGSATDLPPLPSLRELTIVGTYDGASALDTLAALFPQLGHLHVGCDDADAWAPLIFARIPSLTCVTRCRPRYIAKKFTLVPPPPRRTAQPAPQARRVPPPVAGITVGYATLYPNVEYLHLKSATTVPLVCALTALRVLDFSVNGFVERSLRRATYMCKSDPSDVPTDAAVAQLLASLPVLEALDVSVYNGRNMGVTFATDDYEGVMAPRLRILKAAGAGRLRGDGLRALAQMCPNLRHLDVRAAFAMSRRDFVDGLVEPSCSTDTDGAVTGKLARRQTQRLRLPKLRRLYSSFRRRLPKTLNFNVYRGGWTDVQPDESGALGEPRNVETEPLLEPEYVMVRFKPRSNNRRLILRENRGLPVDLLRIEEPVPGEFPP